MPFDAILHVSPPFTITHTTTTLVLTRFLVNGPLSEKVSNFRVMPANTIFKRHLCIKSKLELLFASPKRFKYSLELNMAKL